MDKRYQVFLSSTFTDLKEERKAIIEGLLNARYIPAGMETFSASNDEQFEYIKKIIDTCDYYVLVIGARYGSINPRTGVSFTEQEFDYAIEKNIPVLVFLHDDPYNLPLEKRDDLKRVQLEKFREKASQGRLCKMWHTTSGLVTSVIISLNEEIRNNPQMGWIRGGDVVNDFFIDTNKIEKIKMLEEHIHKVYTDKELENSSRSRRMRLDGALQQYNDGSIYIKAFLPDVYQIPSFELYLEIEIIKFDDTYWAYSANMVRSSELFKFPLFPIRKASNEVIATEAYVVNYVLSEIETAEIDWANEIKIYDDFLEYAMKYYERVYNIKR